MRPIFLPEMRMMLVRIVHAADELQQVRQSHADGVADEMVKGISSMHATIRMHNPVWLLDLLRQIPVAVPEPECHPERHNARVRLAELRAVAHRLMQWWI